MRTTTALTAIALLILPGSRLDAQGEAQLKAFFEGKTVAVKLDLPANEDGVDVYPGRTPAVDFSRYAKRLKQHGTAVKSGSRSS